MMSARAQNLLLLGALTVFLTAPARAAAQAPIDVAQVLAGEPLGGSFSVFEDPSGKLQIDDIVRGGEESVRFVPTVDAIPKFGLRRATLWVRLAVHNSAASIRPWLLELAYPHFDHVTLYVPRTDGSFLRRDTGDKLPFSTRDLAYRNFVFMLQEPGHGERTYYLRIASEGSLAVPLRAWSEDAFLDQQYLDWTLLCAFYGVVLMMAGYNACLFLFTKERAYGLFALAVLATGLFQASVSGHTFQYLWPNQMAVTQMTVLISSGLMVVFSSLFARHHLERDTPPWFKKLMDAVIVVFSAATAATFFLSYLTVLKLLFVCTAALLPLVLVVALKLRLMLVRSLNAVVLGWLVLIVFGAVNAAHLAGRLPTNTLTVWSLQIGASLQFVLVAAGLSARLDAMRAELGGLNRELAKKVAALGSALTLAELATAQTNKATRAKDEFVATLSHELRTPLNAIINIPRGLAADFVTVRGARCHACEARFELELDELFEPAAPCGCCGAAQALSEEPQTLYVGAPDRTIRHLATIERSGRHLLAVVDGILEEGHGAAQLQIRPERVDVALLLRDVVEQLAALALSGGVTLHPPQAPAQLWLTIDPLRLRQVLINLLGNAIKFSDGRGGVWLSAEPDGDGCLFKVRDEGIGIAKEKQARIFETFEQAHRTSSKSFGGTGLGLFIARSLVRLHGGELWVESEPGKGATFLFNVRSPAAEQTAVTAHIRRLSVSA